MSFFGKLKFWKGGDDFDLDSELPPLDSHLPDSNLGNDPLAESPGFGNEGLRTGPEIDFGDPGQGGTRVGTPRAEPSGPPVRQEFSQPQVQQDGDIQRDLELISSKLDTIKAELNSMNQRMQNLERAAQGNQTPEIKKDPWSY